LDQEVHHERSGQTLFIILVPEHHVEHDAIAGVGLMFDLVGDELFDGVIDLQFDVEFIRGCPNYAISTHPSADCRSVGGKLGSSLFVSPLIFWSMRSWL
jgi:hypothetical protein